MPVLFYGEAPVADIQASPAGPFLIYRDDWLKDRRAFPVSLSMPLIQTMWPPETALPWLMNLLPEGEPLRAMQRALGVAQEDVLSMISSTGGDLAGALRMGAPRPDGGDYRPIPGEAALETIIGELPRKPFLVGDDGVTMSLAGAQEKLPVAVIGDGLAIAVNGAPSTHILKPDNLRLPGSVQNEALCMILAARCGLRVAPVITGRAGERTYILVDRYDRQGRPEDGVDRRHQEDFCQALGRPPGAKYERNQVGTRGPSLAEMFNLVREHMTAVDINRLLDAVIFNIAIGNVDSHAKNYSILLTSGAAALAPLYDLMSGLPWGGITQNHAQAVGEQTRGRHIQARHWRRMAHACGLASAATVRRVGTVTGRLLVELDFAAAQVAAMPAGAGPMLELFVRNIRERVRLVGLNAQRDDDPAPDEGAAFRDEAFPSQTA